MPEHDERSVRAAIVENLRALRILVVLPFRVHAGRTVAGLVLLVTSQLSTIAAAFSLKLAVDGVVAGDGHKTVTAVLVLAGATAFSLAGSWASFAVRMGMNELTTLAVDTELARLTSGAVGVEHYERPDYLDRMQVLREEHQNLAGVPDAAGWTLAITFRLVVTASVLARVDARLILLPIFALPSLVANWRAQRRYLATWDAIMPSWRMQHALFVLGGDEPAGREARVFGLQEQIMKRFDRALEQTDGPLNQAMLQGNLEQTAGWTIFGAAFAVGLVAVSHRLLSRHASAGDLVLVLTLGAQLNNQITMFVGMLTQLLRGLRTASRLVWLTDYRAASDRRRPTRPVAVPTSLREGIRFEHVTFAYGGTDVPVLRDVDLLLPAGSTVALVGDNGAGKTTMVKLLSCMYAPSLGRVTVDGIDVLDFDPDEWRANISAAFQDFARFELTAQHVVGSGHLAQLDDDTAATAALVRAHGGDVLRRLPSGLATQLGRRFDDGHELSGGQWQKLALGRSMMRGHPLLLMLDEPTAALDAPTEAALFDRYASAAHQAATDRGGITLLVSHRFSTVRMADVIMVIANGTVAEMGSHTELTAAGGLYAELYDLQARGYR